ncbi:MAG: thiamine phosphate synthase [Gemmatimonadales bacterium]|nr:thiamine phosphate synthase [Gemmatimonadales bacterium]
MEANLLRDALRLMCVTDDALPAGTDLAGIARAAVAGGATSVQLRLKRADARTLVALARALVTTLPVPVLVNDRLDVALAAGAAGVHLGPDDLPVAEARRLVPAGFLLGASVGTEAEVAGGAAADYWGIGPFAVTRTKADAGVALGPAGVAALVARAGGRPCVAIGGVRPSDAAAIRAAGADGMAVVSGLLHAADPAAAARAYRAAWGAA